MTITRLLSQEIAGVEFTLTFLSFDCMWLSGHVLERY